MAIYILMGKLAIWWKYLKEINNIKDKGVKWKEFKKYFKNKYMFNSFMTKKKKHFLS